MLVKEKFIYLFLIFSLELYEMRAQNAGVKVAISKSEEHELEGGSGFSSGSTDLLGFGADSFSNYYVLKSVPIKGSKYNSLAMDIYNSNLKLQKTKNLDLPSEKNSVLNLEDLYQIKNKPIVFYSQFDNTSDNRTLYYQQLDESLQKSKVEKLLNFNTPNKEKGAFETFFSTDSSKIMVVVYEPQKQQESFRIKCFVYQSNMTKLKDYSIDFGVENRDVKDYNIGVSNKGYPLIFMTSVRDEKNPDYGKWKEELLVFVETNSPLKFNLDMKEKAISFLRKTYESGEDLSFVGTIQNAKKDDAGTLGTCFIKINLKEKKASQTSINYFNSEVLSFFKLDEKDIKAGRGVDYYVPLFTGRTANNSSVIVLGSYYTERTNGAITGYYELSKIAVTYQENGQQKYQKVIPNSVYADKHIGRINHVFIYGNNVCVMYNTSAKNLEPEYRSKVKTQNRVMPLINNTYTIAPIGKSKGLICLTHIDETGKLSNIPLTSYKEDRMILAPSRVYCDGNNFVFAVVGKAGFRVIKGVFSK